MEGESLSLSNRPGVTFESSLDAEKQNLLYLQKMIQRFRK